MAHQHNYAIQCHSRWLMLKNTGQKTKIRTIHKLYTTQKKQTMQNTSKQNYPGLGLDCAVFNVPSNTV